MSSYSQPTAKRAILQGGHYYDADNMSMPIGWATNVDGSYAPPPSGYSLNPAPATPAPAPAPAPTAAPPAYDWNAAGTAAAKYYASPSPSPAPTGGYSVQSATSAPTTIGPAQSVYPSGFSDHSLPFSAPTTNGSPTNGTIPSAYIDHSLPFPSTPGVTQAAAPSLTAGSTPPSSSLASPLPSGTSFGTPSGAPTIGSVSPTNLAAGAAPGVPTHPNGQINSIDAKSTTGYDGGSSAANTGAGTGQGAAGIGINAGSGVNPVPVPTTTGTTTQLGTSAPGGSPSTNPGIGSAKPLDLGPMPSAPAATATPGIGQAPTYDNPYAGQNPYTATGYTEGLKNQQRGAIQQEYGQAGDSIRRSFADRGLSQGGMSGLEGQADIQSNLARAGSLGRVDADAAVKGTADAATYGLQQAAGTQGYNNANFDQYKTNQLLPGQVQSQGIQNQQQAGNLKMFQDNYQNVLTKEAAGAQLTAAEAAQKKWVNDNAGWLAAAGFSAALLPGLGSAFAGIGR